MTFHAAVGVPVGAGEHTAQGVVGHGLALTFGVGLAGKLTQAVVVVVPPAGCGCLSHAAAGGIGVAEEAALVRVVHGDFAAQCVVAHFHRHRIGINCIGGGAEQVAVQVVAIADGAAEVVGHLEQVARYVAGFGFSVAEGVGDDGIVAVVFGGAATGAIGQGDFGDAAESVVDTDDCQRRAGLAASFYIALFGGILTRLILIESNQQLKLPKRRLLLISERSPRVLG